MTAGVSGETPMNARELALKAMVAAHRDGTYVQDELHKLMDVEAVSAADKALATDVALGTTRHRRTLDYLLQILLTEPLQTMSAVARIVLECAAYQMLFLDRVPDYAVVNESVTLVQCHGAKRLAGLTNAVLRKLPCLLDRRATAEGQADLRRRIASPHGGTVVLAGALLPADPTVRLGVAASFPDFLLRRWVARWGAVRAENIMDRLNRPPRVFARVNSLRTTPEELLAGLTKAQRAACTTWRAAVIDLTGLAHDQMVAWLDAGLVTVEDPSAMLAVEAMNLRAGQTVLDLCAAPGGKTATIAELLKGQGTVVAMDREGPRLELLRQTVDRLGLGIVRVAVNDPDRWPPDAPVAFDRVLVDVPCTNTGVLNRRADARWRLSAETLHSVTVLQRSLLEQAAGATRVGGLCVYSTCSLEPEENAVLIRDFVAGHPWMALQVERETLPSDRGDGGYTARLLRLAEA